MTAKKKSTGSSAAKTKKAAKERATSAKKKASAPKKKASPKKAAPKIKKAKAAATETVAREKPSTKPESAPPPDRPEGAISSMDVSLGHIFALRPRTNTSFRPADLSQARRALATEVYADLAEAARAVAEEALSMTRGAAARPERQRRR